jgi:hypothetical protein
MIGAARRIPTRTLILTLYPVQRLDLWDPNPAPARRDLLRRPDVIFFS